MRDYCHITLTVELKNKDRVIEILRQEPADEWETGQSGVSLHFEDVRGAGVNECEELQQRGIPYLNEYGSGSDWHEGIEAFDGHEHTDLCTEEGYPLIRVYPNSGNPSVNPISENLGIVQGQLKEVEQFYRIMRNLELKFK